MLLAAVFCLFASSVKIVSGAGTFSLGLSCKIFKYYSTNGKNVWACLLKRRNFRYLFLIICSYRWIIQLQACISFLLNVSFNIFFVDWCYQSQVSCNYTCTGKTQDELLLSTVWICIMELLFSSTCLHRSRSVGSGFRGLQRQITVSS